MFTKSVVQSQDCNSHFDDSGMIVSCEERQAMMT